MKTVVLHEYGGPDKLKWEDIADPVAGTGEVLVRVSAVSVNPIDWKLRSGAIKAYMPIEFPEVLGRDLAGVVQAVGNGVTEFAPGDHVFALANHTYAELCVVKADELAKVPDGLDLIKAGALPLVTLTGEQLVRLGTGVKKGETVLITGAVGSVGRSAVQAAKDAGAKVIAGVRRTQLTEAEALGANRVVALDDEDAMEKVELVDAVADTVGGKTAEMLLSKVKPGGVFASVAGGGMNNAALNPAVRIQPVYCVPDTARMLMMAEHYLRGELVIPIDRMIAMADAAEGQAAAEKGGIGKVILVNESK
jgi:NADPH:quinone reductase-like Zn-dependent oxidoreductase